MRMVAKKAECIDKESVDSLINLYQKNLITHGTFVDCIIQKQKRLVIRDICGEGLVGGEVFLRRMENAGVEITI